MAVTIQGEGPDLVLLHGGGDGAEGLAALQALLAEDRRVIAPEQRGHGRTPDVGSLDYETMADDTAALLETLGVAQADFVGWSDGGIVALTLASRRPDLVHRVVAIGASLTTASDPAPLSDADLEWMRTTDPATVDMPIAVETRRRLLALWLEGPALSLPDLAAIDLPVLVVSADRDMISLEHTIAMFRALPQAQLAVLPGVAHDVPRRRPELVAELAVTFFAG